MKALVKFAKGVGNVEIRDVDEPQCTPDAAKLQVAWCGVCGTDLHVVNDTFRNFPPVILGHEISATIVETGKHVSQFQKGQKVSVLGASTVTCGNCSFCRRGEFMFCPERRGMGHGVNGAFTTYITARPDQIFVLPPNISLEEGALCEPFAAAVHAVSELTPIHSGDVAFVSGPGPIGLLCIKLLLAAGIKTIVAGTEADGLRLELAREMGAHLVLDVTRTDLTAIKEETHGVGVDVAIECSGVAASVRNCLQVLKPLGHYTQVGHFGKEISVPFDLIAFKQLKVSGAVGYTVETWIRMLNILASGSIRLNNLITHKLPLEEWQNGFAACKDKSAIKVLLHP